jgi:hypothetical protein
MNDGSVFMRRMGTLSQPQMAMILQATRLWLGITENWQLDTWTCGEFKWVTLA